MIVFVNQQVYFRWCQCISSEDTCADDFPEKQIGDEWAVNLISYIAASGFNDFDLRHLATLIVMLEYYRKRELTLQSDAIYAVSGILRNYSICLKSAFFEWPTSYSPRLYDTLPNLYQQGLKKQQ
jgi:hypothetical protein